MDFEEIKNKFSNLNPEDPGSWPIVVQLTAGVFATVVCVVLGYMFYIEDINNKIERFKKSESSLKDEYSINQMQANTLNDYNKQLSEVNNNFEKLLNQLPLETNIEGLLQDIDQAATSSGIKSKSIVKQNDIQKAYYYEVPISIEGEGNYNDLAIFIENLSLLHRIVTVHNIDIKPLNTDSGDILSFKFLARTYKYKEIKENKR